MAIDFSILDNMRGPAAGAVTNAERPDNAHVPADLQRECKKQAQKRDFGLEAYKVYQENIKRTEGLQNRIMHGLREGEPIEPLFLMAIEALGLATGDGGVMLRQTESILEERKKNETIQE